MIAQTPLETGSEVPPSSTVRRDERGWLAAILRIAPVALMVTRLRDGLIVDANARMLDLADKTREHFVGVTTIAAGLWDVPSERAAFLAAIAADTRQIPVVIRRRDGETRHLIVDAERIELDGETHLVLSGTDVTDRVRSEREKSETVQRLSAVIESAHVAWWSVGRDLCFTSAGGELAGFEAMPAAALLGRSIFDLFGELEIEEASGRTSPNREFLARVLGGERLRGRSRVLGSVLDTEYLPQLGVAGEVIGILGITYDVTTSARTLEQLGAVEQQLQALANANLLGIIGWDASGSVITANDTYLGILGYTREDLAHAPLDWRKVTPPEFLELDERALAEIAECGTCVPFEKQYIRKDGSRAHVLVAGAASAGSGTAGTAFVVDVTEQRRVEKAYRELQTQLLQVQKMEAIGRLAGGIAHDFNNLLAVISGFTADIGESLGDAHPLQEDLQQILGATDRATKLTGSLLALGRRQVLRPRPVDVNTIITDVDPMLRRLLRGNVTVTTRFAADAGTVTVDPTQLEQVLLNLAMNARDAMVDGGTLEIETSSLESNGSCVPPGSWVVITVRDSGTGMDDTTRSQMFDPFFTTKLEGHGTGLGLAMVYGIVTQSGGHVRCETAPGLGTTIKIFLPATRKALLPALRRALTPVIEELRGSESILVVDDEQGVRDLTARVLRRGGYRVTVASNAGEALLLCEQTNGPHFDLMLTDVMMPVLSGAKLAERLRATAPGLRVAFVSGYAGESPEALQSAPLGKPFTVASLLRHVRNALDS